MNISERFHSALTYYREGRLDEAISTCRRILSMQPNYLDAIQLLAMLYYQRREYNLAITYAEKALKRDPNDFYAFFLLGTLFQEQGDFEKAADHLRKSTKLNPAFADAHYNLAIILEKTNQDEEALLSYKNAVSINPTLADVNNNLGNVLLKMKRFDEAVHYLGKALELNPNYVLACNNMGIALKSLGLFQEAIHYFQKSIELNPSFADTYYNLAIVLKEKGNPDEAERYLRKAIELNPSFADAYCNLALIHEENGMLNEALSCYRKALQIKPHDAEIHWNMSHALLFTGNFKQGWKEYEWRFMANEKPRSYAHPRWDGSSLKGKTLFVHAEQGVGDEIMFASCLPDVIAEADLCIVECDKRLVPLFARSFPQAQVMERTNAAALQPEELPVADMKIAIGSLPLFFRPHLSRFPQQKSYIVPDNHTLPMWRKRFDEVGTGLKIGISWRGGSKPGVKLTRSTVLKQWSSLFSVPGVHFINLQYGDCSGEIREAKEQLGITIHDWEDADPLKDLDSFAAQVAALDLVISVDNATVHMAGAVGVPVWTLLPFACDWRWMREHEDTPWYRTVRLFRQDTPGNWEGVFKRVEGTLLRYIENGLFPEISNSYTRAIQSDDTIEYARVPVPHISSGRPLRCAIITPIGPGHEHLYTECLASVEKSFREKKGLFSEILPIKVDDSEGKMGRSKARNLGIRQAAEQNADWIFFLDADDLMAPSAFESVSPYLALYDAIWGCIWTIERGENIPTERPHQLPFLYTIEDVLSCDPFVTLQMGHFVKTPVALDTLFNENLDTGEDFDYHLRVWEKHPSIKIPLPFFYNRRGFHSRGSRAATGPEWRKQVDKIMKERYPGGWPSASDNDR